MIYSMGMLVQCILFILVTTFGESVLSRILAIQRIPTERSNVTHRNSYFHDDINCLFSTLGCFGRDNKSFLLALPPTAIAGSHSCVISTFPVFRVCNAGSPHTCTHPANAPFITATLDFQDFPLACEKFLVVCSHRFFYSLPQMRLLPPQHLKLSSPVVPLSSQKVQLPAFCIQD